MMLAGITKTSELALDQTEAKSLAEAMGKVSRHYDVTVGAKAMDWTNLLMVAGMVYGPRIVAINENRKANRSRPVQSRAAPVGGGLGTADAHGNGVVDIPGVGRVAL